MQFVYKHLGILVLRPCKFVNVFSVVEDAEFTDLCILLDIPAGDVHSEF